MLASVTLSRIYLGLAAISLALTPLALLVPAGANMMIQAGQPLILGAGFIVAGLVSRIGRPTAAAGIAAASLLLVALSGATFTAEYGPEAMALLIIAGGMLVLVVSGRAIWFALGSVLLVGSVALVIGLWIGPDALADPSTVAGRAASRILTLAGALILIGFAQRRLTAAMDEQIAAARRLAENETRFQAFFASSPQALIIVDGRGRIVDASYLGVSTSYIVEATSGSRLTVYEQNVERTDHGSLHRPGETVQLSWSPDHTFVVREQPATTPPASAIPAAGAA